MTELILASILLPFLGSLLVLVVPRSWVKLLSASIALLSALCSLIVLVSFTQLGKIPGVADLVYLGNVLVFGVVIDKLSVLIGMALGFVGFLIVIYSTGYLTSQNREHRKRSRTALLLLLVGIYWSMAGVIYSSTMLGC